MIMNRRGVLGGIMSMLAAPAIVHAGNLMPVRALPMRAVGSVWEIVSEIRTFGSLRCIPSTLYTLSQKRSDGGHVSMGIEIAGASEYRLGDTITFSNPLEIWPDTLRVEKRL